MRTDFMDRHIFIVYKKTRVNVGAPMTKVAAAKMLILETSSGISFVSVKTFTALKTGVITNRCFRPGKVFSASLISS